MIRAVSGAKVTVKGLEVENGGWEWVPLVYGEEASEEEKMRGFTVVKHSTRVIEYDSPGEYTIES